MGVLLGQNGVTKCPENGRVSLGRPIDNGLRY